MTREEKREYDRKWYQKNREKIREKNHKRYPPEYYRERRKQNHEHWLEVERARFKRINTEEYRAKRRAAYAAKHANDPMTPQRARMIEAFAKREQKRQHEQFYKLIENQEQQNTDKNTQNATK